MALGYARVTKQPAVCLVSAGGGATNIVTAVAQAYKEAVPLFVISSDIGTASFAKGHWASWHGMEHVRLFQPITKQSARLGRVEELGSVLDSLFRQTTRGRQGPVFFCIPEDLQDAHLPEPISFAISAHPAAPAVDARTVDTAVDLLLGARAPVVLAGTGVDWAQAQDEVKELAELLALPVASSYTAKGVFPENHPLALGCLGNGGRMYARPFFQEADLVLAVGTSFSEGTTLGFGHEIIPEQAQDHSDRHRPGTVRPHLSSRARHSSRRQDRPARDHRQCQSALSPSRRTTEPQRSSKPSRAGAGKSTRRSTRAI